MRIVVKKVRAISKDLGVSAKIDRTLNKFAQIVPDKLKENKDILSNTKFNF